MLRKLLKIAFCFARIFWFFSRPLSMGVCAIVLNDKNEVLLVRNSYRHGWYLPGGGVKRGETVLETIKRELKEEVQLDCLEEPKFLGGPYYSRIDFKHDHVLVFEVSKWKKLDSSSGSIEIDEEQFFALDSLPVDLAPAVKRRLKEYKSKLAAGERWEAIQDYHW